MRSDVTVYSAFNIFKEKFLQEKKSIFSDSDAIIFNEDNLKFFDDNFIKKPIEGADESFEEKINQQLKNADENQRILFAHVIWLWSIFANDMRKHGKIDAIRNWLGKEWENNDVIPERGVGNTGQYHKTNKPAELTYILGFFKKVLEKLAQDDINGESKTNSYIQLIKEIGSTASLNGKDRKVAMYNILLHLFEPHSYERIASYTHKEKIINFFSGLFENFAFESEDLDDKIKTIRELCVNDERFKGKKQEYGIGERFDFYHEDINFWKNDIELESKNMILHGAPGTGKTYSVTKSIKARLDLLSSQDTSEQFLLTQFHPSYGYEDFIDGIKPSGLDASGNLKFSLVNGEFKKFCIKAFKELIAAKNESRKAKFFYFIADEINRAEISRVFGELLLCIEDDKRLKLTKDKNALKVHGDSAIVKTQNSNLWKQDHAVVILDDNSNINEEGKDFYFGIPENIYFIGTMNDIDRSVDSFDMALRRRFYWKHTECDYDVVAEKFNEDPKVEQYISNCKQLNQYITSESGFNLGDSYQLGHSYFLKPERIKSTQVNKLWINHISPLLREYLRSEYKENEIKDHLKEASKILIKDLKA
jgi:5-methylcytosine-specific restriction protein B